MLLFSAILTLDLLGVMFIVVVSVVSFITERNLRREHMQLALRYLNRLKNLEYERELLESFLKNDDSDNTSPEFILAVKNEIDEINNDCEILLRQVEKNMLSSVKNRQRKLILAGLQRKEEEES